MGSIQKVVDMFGPYPEKCHEFVISKPGDREVHDIYGVGPLAVSLMKSNGITKVWQLISMVMYDPEGAEDRLYSLGISRFETKRTAATLVACWKHHMC